MHALISLKKVSVEERKWNREKRLEEKSRNNNSDWVASGISRYMCVRVQVSDGLPWSAADQSP